MSLVVSLVIMTCIIVTMRHHRLRCVSVAREAIFVLVSEVCGLLQFLTNLLSEHKHCRPRVAQKQHEEYQTQQWNLQSATHTHQISVSENLHRKALVASIHHSLECSDTVG